MAVQHYTHYGTLPGGGFFLDARRLANDGPRLPILVGVDRLRGELLTKAKQPHPNPVSGSILVDTGASGTCIDEDVLKGLGIDWIGETEVSTPGGSKTHRVYPCGLSFPGTSLPSLPQWFVIGCDLNRQGILGLLGRDYLAHAVLVVSGPGGSWSLSI